MPNLFVEAYAISLGVLTCQYNAFLKNSRPGSIDTTKNELANVSIFKSTMYHIDRISRNFDEGCINLACPIILAEENAQKDNLHLGKSMKADDLEDFSKSM